MTSLRSESEDARSGQLLAIEMAIALVLSSGDRVQLLKLLREENLEKTFEATLDSEVSISLFREGFVSTVHEIVSGSEFLPDLLQD